MLAHAAWYLVGYATRVLVDKVNGQSDEQSLERPQDETNLNATFSTEIKHELNDGTAVIITSRYEANNNNKTTGNRKKKRQKKKKKTKQVSIIFFHTYTGLTFAFDRVIQMIQTKESER